ncbi:uncharacterized protein LOC106172215 [Lingula anatina]|uniref:Uncharacterized protein LOC106172215 n=1 Tax=Lingula anatina TaxID=7574 RepID=A0A1S3JDQ0_LINAN|nr:uncharacterized protein LOC106172215 [Lingula anatina]XP_013408297.1 uncharacterized protein LOC106172215 [Lingula anatina]XP_013408298.1 uncharacterized protein LOC106172215 [Lingula anatina]XP_013408300.1 uncharacterized protein LOC106172215 [Lingula anatina]|eukprot:XP_013408296.1 uncharacterized protein LOC106172215 [Lingula anatina]
MNYSDWQKNSSKGPNGSAFQEEDITNCWNCLSPTSQNYRAIVSSLGILCSLLPAIILSRSKHLRKFAISQYLSAKCAVDIGFLSASTLQWLPTVQPDINIPEGVCQIIVYTSYTCNMLSAWYLCAAITSTYLSLSRQPKFNKTCSTFRSKCYITVLAVMAVILNLYWTWMSGKNRHLCVPMFYYHSDFLSIMVKVELAIVIVIPDLLMIGLTVLSVYFLVKKKLSAANKRPSSVGLTTNSRCQSKESVEDNHVGIDESEKRLKIVPQRGLINVALLVTVLYLIMSLPWHGVRLKTEVTYPASESERFIDSWLHLVSLTHYALNVMLFVAASKRFRLGLWDWFCNCRCGGPLTKAPQREWTVVNQTVTESHCADTKDECVSTV